MTRNGVGNNLEFVTFPAMNSVADTLFFFAVSQNLVVFDNAIGSVLNVDSEEIIVEDIVLDDDILSVVHLDSARIFERGITRFYYLEASSNYAVGFYGQDFVFLLTVQNWVILANKNYPLVDNDVSFFIMSFVNQNRDAHFGQCDGFFD